MSVIYTVTDFFVKGINTNFHEVSRLRTCSAPLDMTALQKVKKGERESPAAKPPDFLFPYPTSCRVMSTGAKRSRDISP
jgi:hypothetical protein